MSSDLDRLVEAGARAATEVKGIGPDSLYQHHEWENWPADETQTYHDVINGGERTILLHRAWRRRSAEIEAAILAILPLLADDLADCQPSTAENPNEDAYQRGRFDGIMEYSQAIRTRLTALGEKQ